VVHVLAELLCRRKTYSSAGGQGTQHVSRGDVQSPQTACSHREEGGVLQPPELLNLESAICVCASALALPLRARNKQHCPGCVQLRRTCVFPKVAATVDSGMMSTVSSSKYSHVFWLLIRLT
jgi:hypothetical protein